MLILDAVRASGGTAIAVAGCGDLDAGLELASTEGIFAAPEGAACVAALRKHCSGRAFCWRAIGSLFITLAPGLKYLEAYGARFPRA